MKALATITRALIPWIIGVAVLIGGYWAWTVFSGSTQAEKIDVETMTAPVVQEDITVKVSATGIIKPITPVNISPKQSGKLQALYVDQGQRVKRGQLLARMDSSDLQGNLLQAQGTLAAAQAALRKAIAGNRPQEILQVQATVRDAQAQLVVARQQHLRDAKLLSLGATSQSAFDQSLAQLNSTAARLKSAQQLANLAKLGTRKEDIDLARANVVQAQGALKTVQTLINDTIIRAPFDGTITQKYANAGAFVTPTTTASSTNSATSSSILAIAGALEAVINVAESDIRQVFPGQMVQLSVDAFPGQVFLGKVRLVAPEAVIVQNVTSFEVRVSLQDPKNQLRSGMNLNGDFIVGDVKNALLIPTTAIVSRKGSTGVLVYNPTAQDNQKSNKMRPIKVGVVVDDKAQVLSGLKLGERVFTTFPTSRKPNDQAQSSGGAFGSSSPSSRPPR